MTAGAVWQTDVHSVLTRVKTMTARMYTSRREYNATPNPTMGSIFVVFQPHGIEHVLEIMNEIFIRTNLMS